MAAGCVRKGWCLFGWFHMHKVNNFNKSSHCGGHYNGYSTVDRENKLAFIVVMKLRTRCDNVL